MALKPWELERIDSTTTFNKMLRGAVRRITLAEDLIAMLRLDVLIAGEVRFPRPGAPHPAPDPTLPTFERLMGRPPTPWLSDPPPPTPEQEEEEAERKREAAEKLARAQAQVWEATLRRNHPNMIVETDPPSELEKG